MFCAIRVGAAVEFTIAPAWFQSYWFFALFFAAGLPELQALYQMRVRQVAHAMSVRFDERLAERTRLARDLHDTLLQTIQASKYVADSALRRSTDSSPMCDSMGELSDWLGHAIDEGRTAVNSLRASTTERNDLAEALRDSIEECRAHGSIEASFSVAGEVSEKHRSSAMRFIALDMRQSATHAPTPRLPTFRSSSNTERI